MTSSKKRQRTLLEYANSSSPVRHSTQKKTSTSSGYDCDSDPGMILFEDAVNEVDDQHAPTHLKAAGNDPHPDHSSKRKYVLQSPPVMSVDSSSSSGEVTRTRGSARFRQSHCHTVSDSNDDSESQQPRKKRRLIKGKRPEDSGSEADDGDENLIEEVDEDMILDSRLRNRSKKSAFAYNLERLQRRRRGQVVKTESDEEEEDDINASNSSGLGPPAVSAIFIGARPSRTVSDDGNDDNQDENTSGAEDDNNDFIVEDGDAEDVPELPTMFSMGTFQDLSHHFKVICQLFVHLAVQEPPRRRSFMEKALNKNYFSVPLTIMRRKLFGMRDSLVTSSIWKPDFKHPLETFPIFRLEQLEFSVPICDACRIGKRVATLRGVLSGHRYNSLTYDSEESEGEEPTSPDWNLGRFCAARAQVFHTFTHWEHILYHALCMEVDQLREAAMQLNVNGRNGGRVFIAATNGPPPPDDLDDADGIMDWLDGRGIISAQWTRIKEMMERAHRLEPKGRGVEDDIELG